MAKPLLFLHPGISKTGSTALQIYFVKHAAQLLQYGLYYPEVENEFSTVVETGLTSGNASSLAYLYQKFTNNDDQLRLETDQWIAKLIEKSKAYSFNAVVLSCEQLCSLTRRQWAILEDALNEYFDLRLIVFSREPYSWVFSSWLQAVKRHGARGWLGSRGPQRDWLPLIFPERLSHRLLRNTVQLNYEECKTDIIGSFFRAIDFSIPQFNSNDKLTGMANPSLTDQKLILMLLSNRLTKGDPSFCMEFSDTLLGHSTRPPCYFYSPEVDGMIDNFFIANGLKRQYPCNNCDPVVNSEKDWFETQSVDVTLMESFFSKLTEYVNERLNDPIHGALAKANYYNYSTFRTQVPDTFNIMAYLLMNKDVLAAGIDPYEHFMLYGHAEGRKFDWDLSPHNSEN